jgi:hypothetical protein
MQIKLCDFIFLHYFKNIHLKMNAHINCFIIKFCNHKIVHSFTKKLKIFSKSNNIYL